MVNRGALHGSGNDMSLHIRFVPLCTTLCQAPHDPWAIPYPGAEALLNHRWDFWSAQAKGGEKFQTTSAFSSLADLKPNNLLAPWLVRNVMAVLLY